MTLVYNEWLNIYTFLKCLVLYTKIAYYYIIFLYYCNVDKSIILINVIFIYG